MADLIAGAQLTSEQRRDALARFQGRRYVRDLYPTDEAWLREHAFYVENGILASWPKRCEPVERAALDGCGASSQYEQPEQNAPEPDAPDDAPEDMSWLLFVSIWLSLLLSGALIDDALDIHIAWPGVVLHRLPQYLIGALITFRWMTTRKDRAK